MRKILFLIAAGVLILVILIVFIILSLPKKESSLSGQNPPPTPQVLNQNKLSITSILPKNTTQTFLPIQQVQFIFDQPISLSSVTYSISPRVDAYLTQNESNSIIVSPKTIWVEGKTTITLTGATAKNGTTLTSPASYTFISSIPARPPDGVDY